MSITVKLLHPYPKRVRLIVLTIKQTLHMLQEFVIFFFLPNHLSPHSMFPRCDTIYFCNSTGVKNQKSKSAEAESEINYTVLLAAFFGCATRHIKYIK